MKTTFSPGPWAVHGGPGEPMHYVYGANVVAVIPEPVGFHRPPAESEANARLVAAAPDLLAALDNITAWAATIPNNAEADIWVADARQAITLALKGTP